MEPEKNRLEEAENEKPGDAESPIGEEDEAGEAAAGGSETAGTTEDRPGRAAGPRGPRSPRSGPGGSGGGKGGRRRYFKKKFCQFCSQDVREIDYKDPRFLRRFITERGKILPRRITGVCAFHQRKLSVAIKRARLLAMLPFKPE
ncbi:MAG: hypothetical protein Kow0059_00850 [Candidatus Sumerlaeia bacterium]